MIIINCKKGFLKLAIRGRSAKGIIFIVFNHLMDMKKFKLVGTIIKEIEQLPIADIGAEDLTEAYEKYRMGYVKDKLVNGYISEKVLGEQED